MSAFKDTSSTALAVLFSQALLGLREHLPVADARCGILERSSLQLWQQDEYFSDASKDRVAKL
jgi:hypothetical protein